MYLCDTRNIWQNSRIWYCFEKAAEDPINPIKHPWDVTEQAIEPKITTQRNQKIQCNVPMAGVIFSLAILLHAPFLEILQISLFDNKLHSCFCCWILLPQLLPAVWLSNFHHMVRTETLYLFMWHQQLLKTQVWEFYPKLLPLQMKSITNNSYAGVMQRLATIWWILLYFYRLYIKDRFLGLKINSRWKWLEALFLMASRTRPLWLQKTLRALLLYDLSKHWWVCALNLQFHTLLNTSKLRIRVQVNIK